MVDYGLKNRVVLITGAIIRKELEQQQHLLLPVKEQK